jgi:hypothetical protein
MLPLEYLRSALHLHTELGNECRAFSPAQLLLVQPVAFAVNAQREAEREKAPTVSLVRSNMAFAGDFALVLALKLVPAINPHYLTDIPTVARSLVHT